MNVSSIDSPSRVGGNNMKTHKTYFLIPLLVVALQSAATNLQGAALYPKSRQLQLQSQRIPVKDVDMLDRSIPKASSKLLQHQRAAKRTSGPTQDLMPRHQPRGNTRAIHQVGRPRR